MENNSNQATVTSQSLSESVVRKSTTAQNNNAMSSCMSFLFRTLTIERWIERLLVSSNENGVGVGGEQLQQTTKVFEEIDSVSSNSLIYYQLVDGVILCKLMSVLKPDSIPKIHPKGTLNFKIRENIAFFLQACDDLGISKFYQFQVNDLFEKKNFLKVLETLEVLADIVSTSSDFESKQIDQITIEQESLIQFTEKQINDVETLLKKLNATQVKRQPLKKSLFRNEPKKPVSNNPRNSMTTSSVGSSGSTFLGSSQSSNGSNRYSTLKMNSSSQGSTSSTTGTLSKPRILSEAQIKEKATPFLKIWIRVQSLVRGYLGRVIYRKRARMAAYRQKIVKELLQTEEVYVNNLEHLSQYYFNPIKKESSKLNIKLEHFTLQLSNLDVIINYNKKLLGMIQPKCKDWTSTQRIGDVFKQFTLYLKVYTQYVKEYNKIFDVINSYRKSNSKFEAFLNEKEYNDPLKSIGTYLILPIQRIPRYTMLLENIVKNTWQDHGDYADLSESLKKMLEVASYVNEKTRDAENIVKVTEIQNNFIGKFDNLAEPHRRFVYEGPLNVVASGKESHRIFYLFNDFLIGTKPITSGLVKRKVSLKVKESIRLNLVSIRNFKQNNTEATTTTTTNSLTDTSTKATTTASPSLSTSTPPIRPTPVTAKLKSTSSQTLVNSSSTTPPLTSSSSLPPLNKSIGSVTPTTTSSQLSNSGGNNVNNTPLNNSPTLPSTMKPPKPAPPPRKDSAFKSMALTNNNSPSSTPPLSSSPNSNTTTTTTTTPTITTTPVVPLIGESSTPPPLSITNKSYSSNSFLRASSPLPNNGVGTDNKPNSQRISSPTPGFKAPSHGSYSSGSSGANSSGSSGSNSSHSTPKSYTPITASPSNSQEKLIDQIKMVSEEKKIQEEKKQADSEKQSTKSAREELMIELVDSFGSVILRLLCANTKDKEHWISLFKKVQEEIDTKKLVNDEAMKRSQEKAGLAIAALSQQYATLRVKGKSVGYSTIKGMMSSTTDDSDSAVDGDTNTTEENAQLPGESNYQMHRRLTLPRKTPNPTKQLNTTDDSTSSSTPVSIKSVPQSSSKEDLSLSSGDESSSPGLNKTEKKSSWFSSLRKKKKVPSIQDTFGQTLDNPITSLTPPITPTTTPTTTTTPSPINNSNNNNNTTPTNTVILKQEN